MPNQQATLAAAVRAHAEEARALYAADGPVALQHAHQLLDIDTLEKAIMTCLVEVGRKGGTFPPRGLAMPSWRVLEPHLQAWVLDALRDGRLIANAIEGTRPVSGNRVKIAADRWAFLKPDFTESCARVHDRIVAVAIMVERAAAVARPQRAPLVSPRVPRADLARVVQEAAADRQLTRREAQARVKEMLPGASRDEIRAEFKKYPRNRGRPRKAR
jgi:hypothetical protein